MNLNYRRNNTKSLKRKIFSGFTFLVEVTRLERAASASRTQRSTKLSHTSLWCRSTCFLFLSFFITGAATQLTLAVPEIAGDFDRGAFSLPLLPPPAAGKLKATKLSHTSLWCRSTCFIPERRTERGKPSLLPDVPCLQ